MSFNKVVITPQLKLIHLHDLGSATHLSNKRWVMERWVFQNRGKMGMMGKMGFKDGKDGFFERWERWVPKMGKMGFKIPKDGKDGFQAMKF